MAAGSSKRLYPATLAVTKSLLPVYNIPAIYFSLNLLRINRIKETLVVCRSEDLNQIKMVINEFPNVGVLDIKYRIDNKSLGMPHSIQLAADWAKDASILVLPSDNVFIGKYTDLINKYKGGAAVCLTTVDSPQGYVKAIIVDNKINKLTKVVANRLTRNCLTAPYIFDSRIFKYIRYLKVSKRGEYEISDILKMYFSNNTLTFYKTKYYWNDIGNYRDLLNSSQYIYKNNIAI